MLHFVFIFYIMLSINFKILIYLIRTQHLLMTIIKHQLITLTCTYHTCSEPIGITIEMQIWALHYWEGDKCLTLGACCYLFKQL